MPHPPINGGQVAQIVRLHDAGLIQKLIAHEVGVSQATVSNYLQIHRPKADDAPQHGHVALFDIPADLDVESRRVVEYVNRQIWQWNKGDRVEAVDLIVDAAQRRLGR